MVKTAQLGESIGNDQAVALLAKIKEEIAKIRQKQMRICVHSLSGSLKNLALR